MTTTNNNAGRRLPAEWEEVDAVMLSWPHRLTDWNYMLDEVVGCFKDIAAAIVRQAALIVVTPEPEAVARQLASLPQERISYIKADTNDTWARDLGAITTVAADGSFEVNDFKFNGWGLKFAANLDNLVTRRMYESGVFAGRYVNRLGFVLEGGSIESDGAGTMLTTSECLLSPNRNGDLTREQIEARLKDFFGLERVLWLDHGSLAGDDTDSHIDTLARLAPHGTIYYVACEDPTDVNYEPLRRMEQQLTTLTTADGAPYNLIGLPLPDPIFDEDGEQLPATYANFLILNKAILLPVYNQPQKDKLAAQMLRIAFPDHEIVTVDCRALIRQHGSLHCVSMQFPKNSIKK